MFSLFRSRRDDSTTVFSGPQAFFRAFDRMTADCSPFDAQGDAHGEIDLRLTSRIEDLLRPLLGPWEQSTAWFHQMDYYGNGVRVLSFRRDLFPRGSLGDLRAMLVGEHADFTILCIVCDDIMASAPAPGGRPNDCLALRAHRTLVTKPLADALSLAGG